VDQAVHPGQAQTSGPSKLSAEPQRIRELERELAIARTERDLFKKSGSIRNFGIAVKYAWVHQTRHCYAVERLRRLMTVSKSGYAAWVKRLREPLTLRRQADEKRLAAIRAAHVKGALLPSVLHPAKIHRGESYVRSWSRFSKPKANDNRL
jgi:hypothetical protein